MKKHFLLILLLLLIVCFVGCSKDNENNDIDTETTFAWMNNESSTDSYDVDSTTNPNNFDNNQTYNTDETNSLSSEDIQNSTDIVTNNNQNYGNNTGNSSQSNPLISDEDLSKLEESNAEVYFSDNPNNKYIVAVVNKYGVDSSNLIALIKVNATFPSAMVLEFSGKRDSNGELVMTYSELKYVYNIDEVENTLVRASKNGIGNDGVTFVESKILFMLMDEYFCPILPELKVNKRYPE